MRIEIIATGQLHIWGIWDIWPQLSGKPADICDFSEAALKATLSEEEGAGYCLPG